MPQVNKTTKPRKKGACNRFKRTPIEEMIIDVYSKQLEIKDKEISRLRLLLEMNRKYLKYPDLKIFQ
jgi:hypothetical protein